MEDLFYARSLMGMSLMFHMIFAAIGVTMPLLMSISEAAWLKTGNKVYLDLAKKWALGTAVLFAIGAVSGTVLSFELGLLWPNFMSFCGSVIGLPLSMEGFAFFTEAIFLGIYLYAWDKIPPKAHLVSGFIVALSGMMSAVFVVSANAWMNAPVGVEIINNKIVSIDPVATIFNPSFIQQAIHLVFASYLSTLFAVAGIHAFFLLKKPKEKIHQASLKIILTLICIFTPLQLISGDFSAKVVAKIQPEKFAAMEAHYHTEKNASLIIGGIPDDKRMEVDYAIKIPRLLSFLAHANFTEEVKGLDQVPKNEWPNIKLVHWAFDLMVLCGLLMFFMSAWTVFIYFRKEKLPNSKLFLKCLILASPLGYIATELGWIVTEVGRQPWTIYKIMKTSHAATGLSHLAIPFWSFTALYMLLGLLVSFVMVRIWKSQSN